MKRHGVKICIVSMASGALNALNAQAEELYMIQIKKYYVYKTGKLKTGFILLAVSSHVSKLKSV